MGGGGGDGPGREVVAAVSAPADVPFVAIGADELGGPLDSTVQCERCGETHAVCDSKPPLLQFYRCGDHTYLCGIRGREIKW